MLLEIITPERKVFNGEVDAVQFPGLDGSFQVLNNHAPIISALIAGELKIDLSQPLSEENEALKGVITDPKNKKLIRIPIKGGVVELLNNKLIVLAE